MRRRQRLQHRRIQRRIFVPLGAGFIGATLVDILVWEEWGHGWAAVGFLIGTIIGIAALDMKGG